MTAVSDLMRVSTHAEPDSHPVSRFDNITAR